MKSRGRDTRVALTVAAVAIVSAVALSGCGNQDKIETSVAAAVDPGGRPMTVIHEDDTVTVTIDVGEKPMYDNEMKQVKEQIAAALEGTELNGELDFTMDGLHGTN